jgi:hypothetical protein
VIQVKYGKLGVERKVQRDDKTQLKEKGGEKEKIINPLISPFDS